MDRTQGKCPDCSLDNQNSHQMLFKSSDGKGRCMNCRATFERNLAAEDRDTKAGVPKTPAKARVTTKPAAQRKAMIPEAEFRETVRGCRTLQEAAGKLNILAKSVRKRCDNLDIRYPGESGSVPPAKTALKPEQDDGPVCEPKPKSTRRIVRHAEVWDVHEGVKIGVRHAVDQRNFDPEQIEIVIEDQVYGKPYPGTWRKIAELIQALEKEEAGG